MCRTRACCGPSTGLSRSHGLSTRYFIAMAHSITPGLRWPLLELSRGYWTRRGEGAAGEIAGFDGERIKTPLAVA